MENPSAADGDSIRLYDLQTGFFKRKPNKLSRYYVNEIHICKIVIIFNHQEDNLKPMRKVTLLLGTLILILIVGCTTTQATVDGKCKLCKQARKECDPPVSITADSIKASAKITDFISPEFRRSKAASALRSFAGIYSEALESYECAAGIMLNSGDVPIVFNKLETFVSDVSGQLATILATDTLDTTLKRLMALEKFTSQTRSQLVDTFKLEQKISTTDFRDAFPRFTKDLYLENVEANLKLSFADIGLDYNSKGYLLQEAPGDLLVSVSQIPNDIQPLFTYSTEMKVVQESILNKLVLITRQIVEKGTDEN